jgi:hypothetical protein
LIPFKNKLLPASLLSEAEVKQAANFAFEIYKKFRINDDPPQQISNREESKSKNQTF